MNAKKTNDLPMVYVEWIDSRACSSHWEYIDSTDHLGVCQVITVGLLLHETDEYLELVMDVADGVQVMGRTVIPKAAVKVLRHLKMGGRKKV